MSRNDGTLSREKIDLLDRVGFKWQPYGHRWRENYLALIQFKERFGHCRVPQKWKENRKLATWVHTQRNRRKFGQLQADRVEALDKLGFNWTADVATWEDRFKQLCDTRAIRTHASSGPLVEEPEIRSLGRPSAANPAIKKNPPGV